ncbi:MAG: hypothetical protein NTZ17_14595 [Phycisphaerae bacterium]|nr:hypothetical protein [Phycisphaerae bacterium]
MKPQNHVERFVKNASVRVDAGMDERWVRSMQDAYHRADAAPVRRYPDYWGLLFESRSVRWAVAAIVFISFIILVGEFGTLVTGSNVAWADVSQRFQSVPFFYASIYMKEGTLAQPQQFELWMGKGGYARMRVGPQVIFGRDGRATHAFDVRRRSAVEVDPMAVDIIRMLATPDEFSFETVIQSISGGKLVDITPAMNTQAGIGKELVVFDAQSAISPGWVRIYALRQSKLPVGVRIWDPAEGFVVDAIITYSKEQPAIFFDPHAFAANLDGAESETGLAYLFLKDPGGREMTPEGPPQ